MDDFENYLWDEVEEWRKTVEQLDHLIDLITSLVPGEPDGL